MIAQMKNLRIYVTYIHSKRQIHKYHIANYDLQNK